MPFLTLIEIMGILACAYAGMARARQTNMDFVGAYSAAFLTAFGGGTLRDLLLGRRPLFWIANPEWPLIVMVLCLVFSIWQRGRPFREDALPLAVSDALGLGAFTASGTAIALTAGVAWFPATMMGVITAAFGGVLRDIICAEVPIVFRRNGQLYVTCAFAGAWVYILVNAIAPEFAPAVACIAVTAGFRLIALRYKLTLPI